MAFPPRPPGCGFLRLFCLATRTFPVAFAAAPQVTARLGDVSNCTPLTNHMAATRCTNLAPGNVLLQQPRITEQTNFASSDGLTVLALAFDRWF